MQDRHLCCSPTFFLAPQCLPTFLILESPPVWILSSGGYTPRRVGSQILVLRFPHFLLAPTQYYEGLEKSTDVCDPTAGKVNWGGPKSYRPISSSGLRGC